MSMLWVRWPIGRSYIDYIDMSLFEREWHVNGIGHAVYGPAMGNYAALCDLIVRGKSAVLDYRPYRDVNKKNGVWDGVTTIEFVDNARQTPQSISWCGEGGDGPLDNGRFGVDREPGIRFGSGRSLLTEGLAA